jgi:hypothetical protein
MRLRNRECNVGIKNNHLLAFTPPKALGPCIRYRSSTQGAACLPGLIYMTGAIVVK